MEDIDNTIMDTEVSTFSADAGEPVAEVQQEAGSEAPATS